MKFDESYVRGAFVVFDPGGYSSHDPKHRRLIPFRFNPEALSRSLQIEQATTGGGVDAGAGAGTSATEQGADASSGALKESFSILVRFDYVDREQVEADTDDDTLRLGVLPEIAALEELMHPATSEADQASNGKQPVAARPQRPTVLLVWGVERVFPVKVTSMTINETLHNAELCPVRAEVEIGLEVARDSDARGNRAIKEALEFSRGRRKTFAQRFYKWASKQTTRVPDLPKSGGS
jgi:hypothetical protein